MKIALMEACRDNGTYRVFYPLGLAYIQSYIRPFFPDTVIVKDLEELDGFEPDVVGVYATSPHYPEAVALAGEAGKRFGAKTVLGGPHITSLPESLHENFDAAVIGEGEKTFLALMRYFAGRRKTGGDFLEIPGTAAVRDGRVLCGEPAGYMDGSEIVMPCRDWKGASVSGHWLVSSRGCPGNCSFCSIPVMWKNTCRIFDADSVAREIRYLTETFQLDFCIFMDDLFALSLERLLSLEESIGRIVEKQLVYSVTVRADILTEPMLDVLYRMGVRYLHFGMESASPRILADLKKTTLLPDDYERLFARCAERGFRVCASYVIGSPQEREEDLQMTCRFIERTLKKGILSSFAFSPVIAFPRTEIWNGSFAPRNIEPVNWHYLDFVMDDFSLDRYYKLCDFMDDKTFYYYFELLRNLYKSALAGMLK